jgi:hypothetical protein
MNTFRASLRGLCVERGETGVYTLSTSVSINPLQLSATEMSVVQSAVPLLAQITEGDITIGNIVFKRTTSAYIMVRRTDSDQQVYEPITTWINILELVELAKLPSVPPSTAQCKSDTNSEQQSGSQLQQTRT